MVRIIESLGEVEASYDVLLSDVWGVIHNGREAFAAPCAALGRWRRERGPVVLISNSPRPSADVILQLDQLGVPRDAWSAIVTSGDATRQLLAARAPGPALRIGPPRDESLYEGLGLAFSGLEAATFISCTGPNDDEVETPDDYLELLTRAAARGLEMVCANPDRVVQRGDRLIYCGGALAALYAELGGGVVMAGKPYAPIYDLCLAVAAGLVDHSLDKSRVLAIGDGVATDLVGANRQGLDALFIASGIHAADAGPGAAKIDADVLEAFFRQSGAQAQLAMANLDW